MSSISQRELDAATLEGVATRYFILEKERHDQLLQSAQAEIDGNRAEIHQLRQTIEGLQRELDTRKLRIVSLETSLSWRLTAPLRRIAGLF
jgi:hypothetical protein